MITLHLTPAEHAHILTLLGRGNTSTIWPGEGLSAVGALGLIDKVVAAKRDAALSAAEMDAPYL